MCAVCNPDHIKWLFNTHCIIIQLHYGSLFYPSVSFKCPSSRHLTSTRCVFLPLFPFCVNRENLERLLDDKHFKDEIIQFNITEETGVVEASHRAILIPLLMRYLWVGQTFLYHNNLRRDQARCTVRIHINIIYFLK